MNNTIRLDFISKKEKELLQIARWRHNCLESLRTPFNTPVSKIHQFKWVDSMDPREKYFFIYKDISDECIGYCGFDKICTINSVAEMSLLIGDEYQGKKYGKNTVNSLLFYGFYTLNLNCIFIEVYDTTEKWKGFWEKQGFKIEGILRKRKYWNGKYYNSIIGSILKNEWKIKNE